MLLDLTCRLYCNKIGSLARDGSHSWLHAPTKQPRQPFLSQSAMRGSHVLACNGVRLTSQLKWRKASLPARFIPYIDCAMLSQFFAYCRDSRVGSYNITVLNSYNCLFIVDMIFQLEYYNSVHYRSYSEVQLA